MQRKLSITERDAILAALRHWQADGCPDIAEIASSGGEHDVLTEGEVDDLCEDLNCGDLADLTEEEADAA